MCDVLKHADVLSDGLLLTFRDGREALIDGKDILVCAEETSAFERVKMYQKEEAEDQ